ncbi:MAG: leucyl/phenylalanyl-tRNA--protein transferase [bacterium]
MIWQLDGTDPALPFPNPETAETDPNGLLAVGGDLTPQRLLNAYRQGVFPWYSEGQPILWWSPDPRMVLFPNEIKISRSLKKTIRNKPWRVTTDTAFEEVIRACAAPRDDGNGTWLMPEMIHAYLKLHEQGHAHSIEVWEQDELIGGLYGISQGASFFGESMFSRASNASKVAMAALAKRYAENPASIIDCQIYSPHLESLGAKLIPRIEFLRRLQRTNQDDALF